MLLMLIDTRDDHEPEDEGPAPLDIDWRLCGWIALTLVLFLAAGEAPPIVDLALAIAGLGTTMKILIVATGGWGEGLRRSSQ